MKRMAVLLLAVTALIVMLTPAQAQQNLLRDPSFEGPYVGRGRPDLNTPEAWGLWLGDSPRNYDWQNRSDRVFAFPHPGQPEIHAGTVSQNLSGGYVTYTAALYQQVSLATRDNVTFSVWGWLKTCNLPKDANGNLTGDNCGSAIESGAYMRAGIDPTGGTNPLSPTVVWSADIRPHDRWEQATVSATPQGNTITVFAFVTQQWPADLNRAYFDDAFLTNGGAGGVAVPLTPGATLVPPTATPVPYAAFVARQPPQPDGSIIHTVVAGDTLAAISFAYGVPQEEILRLSNLRSGRILRIGQRLTIQLATGAATPAPSATTGGSASGAASSGAAATAAPTTGGPTSTPAG
jgi:LysM repeat protein